jgi:hypothetical protein
VLRPYNVRNVGNGVEKFAGPSFRHGLCSILLRERSVLFVLLAEFDISGHFAAPVNWPL